MTDYNIVLLTVDCLQYQRCGFNGFSGETTPFLDSLADESYIFDSAFATGPYTPESVPGFLAGLFAKSTPYSGNLICKAIGHDDPTLPLHLRDQGDRTVATITNTHLSADRNFDRGFDDFTNLRLQDSQPMEVRKEPDSFLDRVLDSMQARAGNQSRYPNPYVPMYVAYRYRQLLEDWPTVDGSQVVDEFVDQLASVPDDQPVFGWTHLMDLHAPLHPEKIDTTRGIVSNLIYLSTDAARLSDISHPRYTEMP